MIVLHILLFLLAAWAIVTGVVVARRLTRRKVHGPNSTLGVGESVVVVKNGKALFPGNPSLLQLLRKKLPC